MNSRLRGKLAKASSKIEDKLFHLKHKMEANSILSSIEKERGKTNPTLIKNSKEYAVEILGWSGYSPWLEVYSAIAGTFKEGWIPDNYYRKVVMPRVKSGYGETSVLKPMSKLIYGNSSAFPDIGYYVNGLFYNSDYHVIHEESIKKLLFEKTDRIIFKLDSSLQGKGVFIFTKENFDSSVIKKYGNGVFQSFLTQHSKLSMFAKNSVATIRVTSIINNEGKCEPRACYLRLGQGSDTHVQSKSHIRVPVDTLTGQLGDIAYTTNWHQIRKHPTSLVDFAGNSIPNYDECVNVIKEIHESLPFTRCVGWDACITDDGEVKIMEWNGKHNDIKFSEATQGPIFSGLNWQNLWKSR
ncbi:sugar-transfer associated ATP-grasp domain-containing protein [Bowmanella pacifica]|uniref:Alpha-L-glutamate ligase-related protein ATP-grasp domain-containing protein n=1 Tax=Bowmanella pacifica TaxID=502051 RepID=A0A918DH12_9ALTE|nr:sugar-transfer associated ATP-grasp domain-containing protein [Bowmanella pacifica]GGO64696.1 hypothetical protein GCM10010982_04750 [Bowmanella pacifica]